MRFRLSITYTSLLLAAVACGDVAVGNDFLGAQTPEALRNDAPLSSLDEIFEGAPTQDAIPEYQAPHAALAAVNANLVASNSPVKSQGRRGTCSIFATTAYMEHLYMLEGTITEPDFSEQYLQWSTKVELGWFTNTEGSSANVNLMAINQFGIPTETVSPYEPLPWDETNDPDCAKGAEGEEKTLPTKCYTNGTPSAEARGAQKFFLPEGEWLRNSDIKNFIANEGRGVVTGLEFFYQSWNHRLSKLPTNADYWGLGYVTYPNQEDLDASRQDPAGHAILIVGWDDSLEVRARDKNGNLILDVNGNAVVERGFYIFKNSWGTDRFGVTNPNGAGYGYISQRYVNEYGTTYTAGLPTNVPVPTP